MEGGWSKDKYLDAKQRAQHPVYIAKRNAEKEKFANVKYNNENIFSVAKQMRTENQDVICEKCLRDDGNFSLDEASKKLVCKQYSEPAIPRPSKQEGGAGGPSPLTPPPPPNIFQQSERALFQQSCKHFLFSLTQS